MRRVLVGSAWVATLALGAGACRAAPSVASDDSKRMADHHVHLLSPQLIRDWQSLGVPFSRPDSVYISAAGLDVEAALLLPMAHLYGNEEFRGALELSLEQEHAAVRRENDHVAMSARESRGRDVAFCGVDISRPYAWAELHRCRSELGSRGIRLHLASAGIDPRRDEDLARVARVAAWADSAGVALWMHVDPQRSGADSQDVRRFIDRVIAPYPRLTIGIAHLGGSGGYREWTRTVYRAFATWLRAEERAGRPRPGVFFDLSAVWLERESEGVPASTAAEGAALAADMREFGIDRLLLGSDYPVFDPATAASAMRVGARLTSVEWERLKASRFPLLASTGTPR